MSVAPCPPFLPNSLEEFVEHATSHDSEWFEYCCLAYDYIEKTETAIAEARDQANQAGLKLQASKHEVNCLKEDYAALYREYEKSQAQDQGIHEYQKGQLQEMQQKYFEALKERDQAMRLETPTVNTCKRLDLCMSLRAIHL